MKMPQTSNEGPRTTNEWLASKVHKILRVIDIIWLMQESRGLNPDWLLLKRLTCSTKLKSSSKTDFTDT